MENCPFDNEPCKNKKLVHFTELAGNGNLKDMHICEQCPLIKSNSFFTKLMSYIKPKQPLIEIKKCLNCGTTLQDIAENARLGCGECYVIFKNELEPVLIQSQGCLKHTGKSPKNKFEDASVLKKKLKEAIKIENYELAGELKKKIASLIPSS